MRHFLRDVDCILDLERIVFVTAQTGSLSISTATYPTDPFNEIKHPTLNCLVQRDKKKYVDCGKASDFANVNINKTWNSGPSHRVTLEGEGI